MPRLMGVDIPSEKKAIYSLQYLYGVGPRIARELRTRKGRKKTVAGKKGVKDLK
jgi:hypothetical protein